MEYKFTVLMSVYKKENPKYLEKSLESVFNQTLKPDEVLLVKDGELTLELEQVIKKFLETQDNFRTISLEKNMGLGEALRVGVESSSFDLIARMDTDDICKRERFEEQIKVFKLYPNIDMVGSWTDEFVEKNDEIKIESVRKTPTIQKDILKRLRRANAFNHPTVMYKKSSVLKAGNYSEEFSYLEDYYLWIRMAINGCQFYNIPKSLVNFRITLGTAKRRGGIKMFKRDIKFHLKLRKLNFINTIELIRNIAIWGGYRAIPNRLRNSIQKKLLRTTYKNI